MAGILLTMIKENSLCSGLNNGVFSEVKRMKTRDIDRRWPTHDQLKGHLVTEEVHDPYKARKKPSEPCQCPQCGAVQVEGRWQWAKEKTEGFSKELCPACHRTNDDYPAGEIILSGGFLATHKNEIIALARHTEQAERADHPLQRIIGINETNGKVVITTTDIHLPRRIGHAIFDAYKGHLDTHYDEKGYFVRIVWERPN